MEQDGDDIEAITAVSSWMYEFCSRNNMVDAMYGMERNAARAPPQKNMSTSDVMPGATAAAATSRYGCWGRKRRDAHPGCGNSNAPPSPLHAQAS